MEFASYKSKIIAIDMKNILTLFVAAFIISVQGFGLKKVTPTRGYSNKIMIYTLRDDAGIISQNKARIQIQEIESDDTSIISKEVEVSTFNFNDDNFIYVHKKEDLNGYALQLAAFADLTKAKDYALEIAKKGDAEKRQLFIYTLKVGDKTWYRVYYGLLNNESLVRQKQQTFQNMGYNALVKEFK